MAGNVARLAGCAASDSQHLSTDAERIVLQALASPQYGQGMREDRQVESQGSVPHVPTVKLDPLRPGQIDVAADLCQPREAGTHGEALAITVVVALHLYRNVRTRTDEDMSPSRTFTSCGNSSSLVRRRNWPTRVTRASSH